MYNYVPKPKCQLFVGCVSKMDLTLKCYLVWIFGAFFKKMQMISFTLYIHVFCNKIYSKEIKSASKFKPNHTSN